MALGKTSHYDAAKKLEYDVGVDYSENKIDSLHQ